VHCNVNATVFKEHGRYGVGMCLNDNNKEYIEAKTSWFLGLPQSQEVEVCGLKEPIIWLGNMNLAIGSIELDCKQVFDGIVSIFTTNFQFEAILNNCKVSLDYFETLK
jgi:hypothetical protein